MLDALFLKSQTKKNLELGAERGLEKSRTSIHCGEGETESPREVACSRSIFRDLRVPAQNPHLQAPRIPHHERTQKESAETLGDDIRREKES